jgi:hypothetical protein
MTIPNETVTEVVKSKSSIEDLLIQQLENNALKQKKQEIQKKDVL